MCHPRPLFRYIPHTFFRTHKLRPTTNWPLITFVYCQLCIEKTKIKKKGAGIAHFFNKKNLNCFDQVLAFCEICHLGKTWKWKSHHNFSRGGEEKISLWWLSFKLRLQCSGTSNNSHRTFNWLSAFGKKSIWTGIFLFLIVLGMGKLKYLVEGDEQQDLLRIIFILITYAPTAKIDKLWAVELVYWESSYSCSHPIENANWFWDTFVDYSSHSGHILPSLFLLRFTTF